MEFQTDRLQIRSLEASDWPELQQIWADFSQSQYAAYDAPLPVDDEGAKALARQFADSGLFFAVRLSGRIIGYAGFHRDGGAYDLGFCFHSAYHGKGYAYESVKALIDRFAQAHPGARFTAGTALANAPSCRLLQRLGFTCVSEETVSFDGRAAFRGGHFILELP